MSDILTSYRQSGESEPIRARIRLVNPNQVELKMRHRGQVSGNVFYSLVTVTHTDATTALGAMIFRGTSVEFYINPADWRRLTGEGWKVEA